MPEAEPNSPSHDAYKAAGFYRERRLMLAKAGFAMFGVIYGVTHIHDAFNADNQARHDSVAIAESQVDPPDPKIILQAHEYEAYVLLHDESQKEINDPGRTKTDGSSNYWLSGVLNLNDLETARAFLALANNLDPSVIPTLAASEATLKERQQKVESLRLKLLKSHPSNTVNFLLAYGMLGAGLSQPLLFMSKMSKLRPSKYLGDTTEQSRILAHAEADLHDGDQTTLPSFAELKKYFEIVKLLPPVGSKIVIPLDDNFRNYVLPVQRTALAVARDANAAKQQYGKAFIHQLTVQGRLPDRFKVAAMALLMNSPYQNDWEQPFYKAPWGMVGPLIHDGGRTVQHASKNWRNVPGRTDFIQRLFVNFDEDRDGEPNETAILANQAESMRMITEARFYQMAAFALHCYEQTAPQRTPRPIAQKMSQLWTDFESNMTKLLVSIGSVDVSKTPWFLDQSRRVEGWVQPRFEADFPPIQKCLIEFENFKKEHPELRTIATRAMVEFTDKADAIVGLQPA